MSGNTNNPNIAYCSFSLNSKPVSNLRCGQATYEAFSGMGVPFVNSPQYQSVEGKGAIPVGRYFIVDRQSGGSLGWIKEPIQDFLAGTDRGEWFGLYRDDGEVDDQTTIDNIRRGAFRLHPVGPRGISQGCITLNSQIGFDELKKFLRSQRGEILPGTNLKYYGVIDVSAFGE
ncbi:DUF2778 domain-containing protein [Pseudomonas syringae]|uniref:DUF2778 domain-containing protein n=1 Tax=Pseudomonas syringae TaxID=317 RepID=UPI0003578FB0|nr:DUF2778 domain-containing protein [Pseudomonas syringae]EPM58553.1 hypothetical protein A262_12457 [Pseudomonas syringae pv. actinidiae ICMP 19073]OSN59514.1 hypothetical protein BV349_05354 [Pseudomonas syringae pv. actinidiae]OSN68141.1 hypothetical protein BV351_05387 [Pseudomonas syringae pv. actinidiae]RMR97611.1 hypothetical protein ALP75_201006 [Pseudomonas syringae pv. actinidiae]